MLMYAYTRTMYCTHPNLLLEYVSTEQSYMVYIKLIYTIYNYMYLYFSYFYQIHNKRAYNNIHVHVVVFCYKSSNYLL